MPTTDPRHLARRAERNVALGRLLAAARTRAGLSQAQAARRLGVPQTRIGKIELGQRAVTFVEGLEFAELYRVEPIELDPRTVGDESTSISGR